MDIAANSAVFPSADEGVTILYAIDNASSQCQRLAPRFAHTTAWLVMMACKMRMAVQRRTSCVWVLLLGILEIVIELAGAGLSSILHREAQLRKHSAC